MLLITQFHKYITPNRDDIVQSLIESNGKFIDKNYRNDCSLYAHVTDESYSFCIEVKYKNLLYMSLYHSDKPTILNLEIAKQWNSEEIEDSFPELNLPSDMDEAAFFQYSVLHDIRDYPYALYKAILDFSYSVSEEVQRKLNDFWTEQYFLYENKLYKYTNGKVQFYSAWNRLFHDCPHVSVNVLFAKGQKL